MKLKLKSAALACSAVLTASASLATLAATAAPAHASGDQVIAIVIPSTPTPSGETWLGILKQIWHPSDRTVTAAWDPQNPGVVSWSATTTDMWLENGPNTRTLTSAHIYPWSWTETSRYPIDNLAYPKTIDAAAHLVYYNAYGKYCDIWFATPSHDYSTGGQYGGSTNVSC